MLLCVRARAPLVAVCLVTVCVRMAGNWQVRVVRRDRMVSLEQACRDNGCIVYIICVNRTIYIFLINGHRLAYVNETIGLVLVLQTILPTTIGAVTRIISCQPGVEGLD